MRLRLRGDPHVLRASMTIPSRWPRLADAASARLALSRLLNVSSASAWVCFGGSYAGALASWARLKVRGAPDGRAGVGSGGIPAQETSPARRLQLPHLFAAAVASSAPVRAVLDFAEYNAVGAGRARRGGEGQDRAPAPLTFP